MFVTVEVYTIGRIYDRMWLTSHLMMLYTTGRHKWMMPCSFPSATRETVSADYIVHSVASVMHFMYMYMYLIVSCKHKLDVVVMAIYGDSWIAHYFSDLIPHWLKALLQESVALTTFCSSICVISYKNSLQVYEHFTLQLCIPEAESTSVARPGKENVKNTYEAWEENLAPSPDNFTVTLLL